LIENRLEQVKWLKPVVQNFPHFIYGKKRCRKGEGFGTTLALLYAYEEHRDVKKYLDLILEFGKNPAQFDKKEADAHDEDHSNDDHEGKLASEHIAKTAQINDVRIRRVWSLILKLLYDDNDKEAPLDEHVHSFETGDTDNNVRYKDDFDYENPKSEDEDFPGFATRPWARCAFPDRNLHPRMPLVSTPARLKRTCMRVTNGIPLGVMTPLTGWHCKLCRKR
jgi:hypothetical protein